MKKLILITLGLIISNVAFSQLYFGAGMRQANFKQFESSVYAYSAYDLDLELKYQIKSIAT